MSKRTASYRWRSARDIVSGSVKWTGKGVLNPFADDGSLVRLSDYPRLARHLETHGAEIRHRHVAKKNPNSWYRTIDRIYPNLTFRPKLLIPDIKGNANIVLEEGKLYPHHNLYFIVSDEWELRALQAVLLSGIAKLFVSIYSTKMRGGYLRFQAQYLRRIRIPRWSDVSVELKTELVAAAKRGNKVACRSLRSSAFTDCLLESATLSDQLACLLISLNMKMLQFRQLRRFGEIAKLQSNGKKPVVAWIRASGLVLPQVRTWMAFLPFARTRCAPMTYMTPTFINFERL